MKENCKGILISNKIYCNNDKLNTYIAFVTLHMVSIHCKKNYYLFKCHLIVSKFKMNCYFCEYIANK